ncbi:MAG: Uma2 family endonuclease [Planctomycetota bacterium]
MTVLIEEQPVTLRSGLPMTPEAYDDIDASGYELVDGELELNEMGFESTWIAGRVFIAFSHWADAHPDWLAAPVETVYGGLGRGGRDRRKPDASLIRLQRLPGQKIIEKNCPVPPDVAVEVISPSDQVDALERKISTYFRGGVAVVLIFYPVSKSVLVRRPDGSGDFLSADQTWTHDLLPGFELKIGSVFPPEQLTPEREELPDDD